MRVMANQLQPPPYPFIDRDDVLAALAVQVERATRDDRPALVALDGLGGIGVTSTALQFYAKHKSWFPDGALQVKLSDPQ
ncbi:hypothetical protein SAMN05216215_104524 [Saccharopolyspora shandongensis]|uniref:Uncharacterized protein n=2 Tax=Saccharopolyspora shandongensis TaxID=418495 RepID=A0A1H3Q1L4_9PSEU|nr:hypothetical protein [Saccharopolyspora shandongensis]SDZ07277.1 hypothetical protein SAMN05216215_104524 [Saccharopolyspora shandongensis]